MSFFSSMLLPLIQRIRKAIWDFELWIAKK